MTKVIDHGRIVHRTHNRMRVRVQGRRNDQAFFQELKRNLIRSEGVCAVDVNPLTASIVIEHKSNFRSAAFSAVGIALVVEEQNAGGPMPYVRPVAYSGAAATRGDNAEMLFAVAKLICAAMTGRLWSHILERIIEWCADAVIVAILQPMHASAEVIRLPQAPHLTQQHALPAAA